MPMYKVIATIEVNTEAEDETEALEIGTESVSYTHLTLPTKA